MAKQRKLNYAYGGKGGWPTWEGKADDWWVNMGLSSVPRLLLATYLAVHGPTALMDLPRYIVFHQNNLLTLVKAMAVYHLLDTWLAPAHMAGRWPVGQVKKVRVAAISEDGRRELWRYGWVTRQLKYQRYADPPLRDDVPEDPIEAIRECVRPEFLRPSSLALADELYLFGAGPLWRLYLFTGNKDLTFFLLRKWRDAGLTGRRGRELPTRKFYDEDWWEFTPLGRLALERHIDAMRRVSIASGYGLTLDCDTWWPRPWESPCARSITGDRPSKCECCPWRPEAMGTAEC